MSAKTRLIVLTNLHNPSCALLSEADLLHIGALAERIGARVLVDEVYLDLLGDQTPKSAFHLERHFFQPTV